MEIKSSNTITRIRVRYADTDQMGIAYNGIYFTWFEVGRTELIRHTGLTYSDIEKTGVHLPLIEEGIKFLKPAHYDDLLSVKTMVEWQKGVRVRFKYEILRNEEKLAVGFTEHVFTDENLRPTKPPKELADLSQMLDMNHASSIEKEGNP